MSDPEYWPDLGVALGMRPEYARLMERAEARGRAAGLEEAARLCDDLASRRAKVAKSAAQSDAHAAAGLARIQWGAHFDAAIRIRSLKNPLQSDAQVPTNDVPATGEGDTP